MGEGEIRSTDYPVVNNDGMSFLNNGWVFTGPQGYRVVPEGGTYTVVYYNAAGSGPVYNGTGLDEDAAHDLASRLRGRVKGKT